MKNREGYSAELANFSCQLQHLYQASDDPSRLALDLVVTQGKRRQSLTIDYNRLDQLDIQRLVPGCVYLASRAKAEIAVAARAKRYFSLSRKNA